MTWETPEIGMPPHERKKVVIAPVNMTANGPAHLGHVGGPFLRMDVLNRHLKRLGHETKFVMTTDHYENHVQVKAIESDRNPVELANTNYHAIREGFISLKINVDHFPNTGVAPYRDYLTSAAESVRGALSRSGSIETVREKLPVDDFWGEEQPLEDRFCLGGWFGAVCPECGVKAGSFLCEQCGAHFTPEQALEAWSERGEITDWLPCKSAFMTLPTEADLIEQWGLMGVESDSIEIGRKFLTGEAGRIRLSLPGTYGIPWQGPDVSGKQICFSYTTLLYAHPVMCGEVLKQNGWGRNPFKSDDDSILICATGVDNTVPLLVGVVSAAIQQESYRSFDRAYFNRFLSLEGEKFSTSRGHVIWAHELSSIESLNIDILRAYLCEICPEEYETDFRINEFVAYHNSILEKLDQVCLKCRSLAESRTALKDIVDDQSLLSMFETIAKQQYQAFDSEHLRISRSVAPILDWIDCLNNISGPNSIFTWMKCFSYLSSPIMPGISKDIARWLGFNDTIRSVDLNQKASGSSLYLNLPRVKGNFLDVDWMRSVLNLSQCSSAKEMS